MTLDQAQRIMPRATSAMLAALVDAMAKWHIDNPAREAAFLAQIAHESLELTVLEENLNYSANALIRTWPNRFNTGNASAFAYHPEMIANHVYADRLGNGNEESGDGWRFRGRGPIQITGRGNYRACGAGIGRNLLANPELLKTPNVGAESACWYWGTRGLNDLADKFDFPGITLAINGGMNGYEHRLAYYQSAKQILGVS